MNIYFSTCVSGLADVAVSALSKTLPGVDIKSVQDGLCIYRSDAAVTDVIALPFFNNTFSLIKTFKEVEQTTKGFNAMIKLALNDKNTMYHLIRKIPEEALSYRVIVSFENTMMPNDRNVMTLLEDSISSETGLRVEKSLPDVEIWFYVRREGNAYLGVRLTRHTEYAKLLEKGELRPELAYLMCYMANPKSGQTFLDPFAGSGAIPFQASTFDFAKVIASDHKAEVVKKMNEKIKKTESRIVAQCEDALHLHNIPKAGFNAIVTDPPWGISNYTHLVFPVFYSAMLDSFARILAHKGIAVILVAKKEIFDTVVEEHAAQFLLKEKYDVLVSGQKAGIYKLQSTK